MADKMANKYKFNKYFLCALAVVVVSAWCMAVAQALTWVPPNERTACPADAPPECIDDAPLQMSEIGGYKVYYGESSGNYNTSVDINGAENTSYNASFATAGRRYFVVTAYDTDGRESAYSAEVWKDYEATIPDSTQAKPATDFMVTKIDELKYRVSYKLPTEFTDGKPIHGMSKLYPFEHKDDDSDWRGTWQFNVDPVTDSFEITVTEGKHFYTMEVETKINNAFTVSERGDIFVIDATVQAPLEPPKPPLEVKFDETDILKL